MAFEPGGLQWCMDAALYLLQTAAQLAEEAILGIFASISKGFIWETHHPF